MTLMAPVGSALGSPSIVPWHLRERRSRFVRPTLAEDCPALVTAHRVAFQIGAGLVAANQADAAISVIHTAPIVESPETPHAHLIAIDANGRVACRIARVAEADQAAFDTAAGVHGGSRDKRYAGGVGQSRA